MADWPRIKPHGRKQLPDADIIARYNAGESCPSIARIYGVTHHTIASRVRDAGVTLRTRSEATRFAYAASPEETRRRQNKTQPLLPRFWSKVNVFVTGDACWEWTASLTSRGYGHFVVGGRSGGRISAHRFAWSHANGPIPEGLLILHQCDNRKCVRPSHLRPGTFMDNSRDALDRGRAAIGERNGAAKLTAEQIVQIRIEYKPGSRWKPGISQKRLANKYNVSQAHISDILLGRRWRHLTQPAVYSPRAPTKWNKGN